jgi:gas vesicle protein
MAYAGKVGESHRIHGTPKSVPRKRSRPVGAVATGLAIGLLVGAGVALLFAPQLGSETRHNIKRGLRRAGRRGHDAWEDLGDQLQYARRRLSRARFRRRAEAEAADLAEA